MLSTSEIKKQALNNLKGKWSQVIVLTLIYTVVSSIISMASNFVPGISILLLVVTVPFSYGLIYSFMKIYRNENFSYGDLFTSSFTNFAKVWKVTVHQLLKLIVPIILVFVSIIIMVIGVVFSTIVASNNSLESSSWMSILSLIFLLIGYFGYIASLIYLLVKELYYTLSYYILYDNPDMPAKEIVEKSKEIMNGQRGKYFCLELSFIGWILLSILTFGIGLIFVTPYIQISALVFYEDRIGKLNNN